MKDNPEPLYLVIDQGGQSSRALVFNQAGEILSQSSAGINTFRDGDDRVEHSAAELLASIHTAVKQSTADIDPLTIESVGLACQRSSIVCWDRNSGEALSPVLSWQDRRAADSLTGLESQADNIHLHTGLFLSPHYGASKLRWCLDHVEEVRTAYEQGRLVFGPLSSFLLCNLLEERPLLTDPVSASRTLLWNLQTGDWDPALLKLFNIPQHSLPRCVPNQFSYGHMMINTHAVPLKVSTGDQPAALYSSGIPQSATTYINIGTGAFLQRVLGSEPMITAKLLSSLIWQSKTDTSYVLEGTVNGAASAIQYIGKELGLDEEKIQGQLVQALNSAIKPILFLNGISGLGSPYWNPDFESRFIGEGSIPDKLVAVLESIVFLIQANLKEMASHIDTPEQIVISGGLSALDGLCQRLASISGISVQRNDMPEATARGMAFLLCESPHFSETTYTHFESVSDADLVQRYNQWSMYMNG